MMKSIYRRISLFVGVAIVCSLQQLHAQSQSTIDAAGQQSLGQISPEISSDQSTQGLQLVRDENGRLAQVVFSNGDFVQYRFDDKGKRMLDKTSFGGIERDREASVIFLANRASTKSAFGEGCGTNILCLGILDDLNKFIGNLANWLEVGVGAGATITGTIAVANGAEALAVLEAAGIGGFVGGAVVLAFAGGYIIGTGLNEAGEYVYYTWIKGKLTRIPDVVFSDAYYSGD